MPPKSKKKATAADEEPGTGIDHYEVPRSTIARVAKGSVPEGVKLSKEVPIALVRATTVFISYLAAISQDVAAERSHKTINAQHVLDAVQMLDWEDGKQVNKSLAKELKAYKAKKNKKKKPTVAATPAASEPVAVRPSSASLSAILDNPAIPSVEPETQLQADEDDAESFGEPEEDDIVEEEESEEEPEEEVAPEVEDRGLQDDDAHMKEADQD